MLRTTLKGLLDRKLRTIMSALAIVLGVAMVSGTYVLTDTLDKAFGGIFESSYDETAVVISGKEIVEGSASGSPTVPEQLIERVEEVRGVESASGQIFDLSSTSNATDLLDADGEPLGSENAEGLAFGVNPDDTKFTPLNLADGNWANAPGEIAIDRSTAEDNDLSVGDTIQAASHGRTEKMEITGTVEFGSLESLGNATLAVFDVMTAQGLVGKEGQLDQISVAAQPGVSPDKLAAEIARVMPGDLEIETGATQAASDAEDSQEAIDAIRAFLLAFAGISLFVGAFVIFNTLSMTIAQRIRELATLRTLGASRAQILGSLLLEGLIIGAIASALGVLLGLLLAKGLTSLFDALGLGLPDAPSVFEARTAVVSVILGISVTVISTVAPALRATGVPPIAAVREGATLPRSAISQRRLPIAAVLAFASIALIAIGVLGDRDVEVRLAYAGLAALALFIAVVLIGPAIARPLSQAIGAPFRRLGVAGDLGVHNAGRNPARTARTASALMIGLTLVTLVAALGSGLRGATRGALESQITAEYVIEGSGDTDSVPVAVERELDRSGLASSVVGIRSDRGEVLGDETEITAVNQLEVGEAYRFYGNAQDELPGALLIGGAIVDKGFADEKGLELGSAFEIKSPAGERVTFTVRAFEDAPAISRLDPILGKITISEADFDRTFDRPANKLVLVNVSDQGQSALAASGGTALNQFASLEILPREEWIDERVSGVNQLLNLLYVLLGLSVIVSLFGMLNALALAVFERTREIGMLRAVGLERRQLRQMIRDESIVIALIGGVTGMALGLVLAAIVAEALSDEGVTFSVPFGTLVVFTIVAVLAGVVASILPARRAGRLDVLTALQYE